MYTPQKIYTEFPAFRELSHPICSQPKSRC